MEVVKTTSAGHARKLASTVDFSTCPDGIHQEILLLEFLVSLSAVVTYLTLYLQELYVLAVMES